MKRYTVQYCAKVILRCIIISHLIGITMHYPSQLGRQNEILNGEHRMRRIIALNFHYISLLKYILAENTQMIQ